jgi:hypothetical protein
MNSENNNNKQTKAKKVNKPNNKYFNPFRMNILDDIYDPFEDLFGFENKMFKSFQNVFNDLELLTEKPKEKEEKKEIPKKVEKMEEEPKEEEINTDIKQEPKEEEINTNMEEEPKEEEINTDIKQDPKEEEINTNIDKEKNEKEEKEPEKKLNDGTFYSKVYYSSYNNLNGKPNKECYQSQSIKQINNGHNISETKEAYKNSDGIEKSAYQRGLDDKTARFIKEKNIKTGKKDQHKVIKGIEENEIKDFNKEYDEFSKKCGFRKFFHNLDNFEPFGFNRKQLNYGNPNLFLPSLFF